MKITENELRELLLTKLACDNIKLVRSNHDPLYELRINRKTSVLNGRFAHEETLQDFIQYALEDWIQASGFYDVFHDSFNVFFDPQDSEPVAYFYSPNSLSSEPLKLIHLVSGHDGMKCYGGSYEEMNRDITSGKLIVLPRHPDIYC